MLWGCSTVVCDVARPNARSSGRRHLGLFHEHRQLGTTVVTNCNTQRLTDRKNDRYLRNYHSTIADISEGGSPWRVDTGCSVPFTKESSSNFSNFRRTVTTTKTQEAISGGVSGTLGGHGGGTATMLTERRRTQRQSRGPSERPTPSPVSLISFLVHFIREHLPPCS